MDAPQPEPPRRTTGAGGIRSFGSRRVAIMVGLGVASALPNSLADSTLATWMATLKVDLKTIGYFSLVLLPYNIKFLWAPFLDRWRLPLLGRRRGWMLAFLLSATACVFLLGSSDPRGAPGAVAALALTLAFMGASFDIVNDAYKTDVLRPDERAAGNAAYTTGWRVALLLTGSVALVLAEWLPWRIIYIGLGCVLSVGVVCTLIGPEPEKVVRAAAHVSEGRRRTVRRLLPPAALAGRGRLHALLQLRRHDRVEDAARLYIGRSASGWSRSARSTRSRWRPPPSSGR